MELIPVHLTIENQTFEEEHGQPTIYWGISLTYDSESSVWRIIET